MGELIDPENYESTKTELTSAAIVGHTNTTTSRIWFRAPEKGSWALIVSKKPLKESIFDLGGKSLDQLKTDDKDIIFVETKKAIVKSDLTICFDIKGLKSATKYYYYLARGRLSNSGRRVAVGSNHDHQFRTLPSNTSSIQFGFYSCHDPYSVSPTNEGLWPLFSQLLDEKKADFVIGGGDQVYCDTNDKSRIQDVWVWLKTHKNQLLEKYTNENGNLKSNDLRGYFRELYRTYYRVYWNFEELLSVYKQYPQYMIWDDHEIMDGWGSLNEDERKEKLSHWFQDDDEERNFRLVNLMFEAACDVYWEYQHSHNPETGINLSNKESCEWDYGVYQGKFGFYFLDMRGHHDCEKPEGERLLGYEQFTRFKKWLRSQSSRNKEALFIVSPVPVVHWNELVANIGDIGSYKDDFMDEWGHSTNTKERNKFLDLLLNESKAREQPIVILSGDVHCASAFRIKSRDFQGAQVFNVTSSAISRKPAAEFVESLMEDSGSLRGYEAGRIECLYKMAGRKNFSLISAESDDDGLRISVNFCWADPDSEEVSQRIIRLVD